MSSADAFPYRVEETLGRGGMGAVYRALDLRSQRHVALKVLSPSSDATRLARFQREGELTARLDHPGIVRVHEAGVYEGRPFLAYELVEGCCTLEEAFRTRTVEERLELVVQAAEALGYAHARGIVHRDVKPENVLVDATGRVKVADFGVAVAGDVERLTRTGALVGTPHYMAPEQITAERGEVGPWSDVWALGVISYRALTDRLPFGGETLMELAAEVVGARLGRLPGEVGAVVGVALERSVERRWASGAEFAEALRGAISGGSRSRWSWWVVWVVWVVLVAVGWWGWGRGVPVRVRVPEEEVEREEVGSEVEAREFAERTPAGYRALRAYLSGAESAEDPRREALVERLRVAGEAPLARRRLARAEPTWVIVRFVGEERLAAYMNRGAELWSWRLGSEGEVRQDGDVPIYGVEAGWVVRARGVEEGEWGEGGWSGKSVVPVRPEWETELRAAVRRPGGREWAVGDYHGRVWWISAEGEAREVWGGGHPVGRLVFSGDARRLYWLSSGGEIRAELTPQVVGVWDREGGEVSESGGLLQWRWLGRFGERVVCVGADGTLMWVGPDGSLRPLREGEGSSMGFGGDRLGAFDASFAEGGRWLVVGEGDNGMGPVGGWRLVDVETGDTVWERARGGPVVSVSVSPDGHLVVCGLGEGRVEVWGLPLVEEGS